MVIGQNEGGFDEGDGWMTMEELVGEDKGQLPTHAQRTYKVPACSDRPRIFNVQLLKQSPNKEETIFRSKAVGEPPFVHGVAVLQAISDALASIADYKICPKLDAPATPECILRTAEKLTAQKPNRNF